MDGSGHYLSLKVMRVSRPALASAWQPFYSSSPSFSAHSTASIVSLQGKTPLPGHPKTLRDLTHASELLTLPSSFGSIQLGETFSSCLSVNNEAIVDIEDVSLRVEMQTANTKTILMELGGPECRLAVGDALEHVVHHEIKELGQHVLACIVTYRLPPGARHSPGSAESHGDPNIQGFRKFYKFVVTNPLSVKTKVHLPRSPSAQLSSLEREKVFLEVHIQNMTQDSLWFDRMHLDCADGWVATDANVLDENNGEDKGSIFSGSMALMQPQDVRQYIYILTPVSLSTFPLVHAPGTTIVLGRLDISWRSSFGEPGRLLTSMLSRRVPIAPAPPAPPQQPPPSAIPSYLQRVNPPSPVASPRPRSPQLVPSRPGTPPAVPYRSGSPFRNKAMPGSPRPQSPSALPSISASIPNQLSLPIPARPFDLEVDLCVQHVLPQTIRVEEPFKLGVRIAVAGALPSPKNHDKKVRIVSLVVQHLQPPRAAAIPDVPPSTATISSRFSSLGMSSSSTITTPIHGLSSALTDKLVSDSPLRLRSGDSPSLPPPYFESLGDDKATKLSGSTFLGPSAISLEPIYLSHSSTPYATNELDQAEYEMIRAEAVTEIQLSFLPLRTGFVSVGGLRILLVGDRIAEDDREFNGEYGRVDPRILKEMDVIAEIWVNS